MNEKAEYDSLKETREYQENMLSPGHYIATGRVPPTVSAPGNATPLVVLYFFGAAVFVILGLLLFFSEIKITGIGDSETLNKVIALVTMLGIALFFLILGFKYLKKARKYYKDKAALEAEPPAETEQDALWQRTCPRCGRSHDIDYPKCPFCKFSYLE